MQTDGPPKRTVLCEEHQRLGARMVEFGGWWMPVQYTGILTEHRTVRTNCGLFDISHMGEVRVSGPGALAFLNRLLTNDAARLAVGQGQYSLLCNERGGVADDLYVYHVASDTFLVVINASHIEEDFRSMQSQRADDELVLANVSDATAGLALQGPNAARLLERICPNAAREIPRNHIMKRDLFGHEMFIARTGYTGEDGFELFMLNAAAQTVWRELLALGATPCGLGARDTLRLEMGYPLHGNDLAQDTTPIEAGLGAFVALGKQSFVGKEILQRQHDAGTDKRLVAFTMNERSAIPRAHYPISRDGRPIGEVTSGTMSPSLQIGIGMGYVKTEFARIGETIAVQIRGKSSPATVVTKPFYKRTDRT